jgi:hypothetical protein
VYAAVVGLIEAHRDALRDGRRDDLLDSPNALDVPDDSRLLTFTDTDPLEYSVLLSRRKPDKETARKLLAEHGDVFRQHLLIALLLEEQADALEESDADKRYGKVHLRGYKVALRHTIADLRMGDFLPGRGRFAARTVR